MAIFKAGPDGYNVATDTFAGVTSVEVARSTYAELAMGDGSTLRVFGEKLTYSGSGSSLRLSSGTVTRVISVEGDGTTEFDLQKVSMSVATFLGRVEAGQVLVRSGHVVPAAVGEVDQRLAVVVDGDDAAVGQAHRVVEELRRDLTAGVEDVDQDFLGGAVLDRLQAGADVVPFAGQLVAVHALAAIDELAPRGVAGH